jgi:hypothetical protein
VLVIEVQSPFHQGSMAQDPQRALLADALYATLGIRPQLSFAAAGRPTSAPEAEQAVTVEATEPAEDDPVELIKKRLGGEVVEERREELKP